MSAANSLDWRDATREVKRAVPVRQVLRDLRVKFRGRRRADCPCCTGSQPGTLAFDDAKRVWHCFRCQRGGSVVDLIMVAKNCDVLSALKFLAAEARLELPSKQPLSAAERARFKRERAERERRERELDEACAEFEAREREMRKQCRDQIHKAEKVLYKPGRWLEADWVRAKAALVLRESLLVEYSLLSFGSMEQRLFYVVGDIEERNAILAKVREAGAVVDRLGRWIEVLQ